MPFGCELDQAWVTFAKDEEAIRKALVLAKSLRRVKTNKKLVVLTGRHVTANMRQRLELGFDMVLELGQDLETLDGLSDESFARIFALNLTFVKKLVFLDVDSLVLRNSDELFDSPKPETDFVDFVDFENFSSTKLTWIITPQKGVYSTVVANNLLGSNHQTGNPEWLVETFISQNGHFHTTGLKYNSLFNMDKPWEDFSCTSIVHFFGTYPKNEEMYARSTVGKLYWKLYQDVQSELKLSVDMDLGPFSVQKCHPKGEPIAIVGMACRLPGSNSVNDYWDLLINKRDAMRPVPEDRWTADRIGNLFQPQKVRGGFLDCPVDEVDGKFFAMSPMELSFTDPQQRLLLEVAWEAFEDAAINPTKIQGSHTGVFTGAWSNDYKDLLATEGKLRKDFFRTYIGNAYGATAGRLAHFFRVTGPNISTESGCSSSIVSVGLGCHSLRRGETDLVLACGVNLIVHPFVYDDLKHIVSPQGRSRPFDANADGFVRAEGCAVLVMKRLSDAVRDNDRIHALIRGYGQAQEGLSKSMGTPTVHSESLAIRLALEDAGVEPQEVSFVEAHGTGTPVGDPIEIESIGRVYSGSRAQPLVIGSAKANIGHTESCSGMAGIIKTILALRHETIPPQINLDKLNPRINLDGIPALVPLEPVPWKRDAGGIPRIAGVSSYGITGTDAHLILEEPPQSLEILSKKVQPPFEIVTFSAKSEEAFDDLTYSMADWIAEKPQLDLSDISYTANVGRANFPAYRAAVIASDTADLVNQLRNGTFIKDKCPAEKPKLCFLFSGHGSQYHGMGKMLYQACPVFRQNFDICINILKEFGVMNFKEVLWSDQPHPELRSNKYSSLSLFCIEYCLTQVWTSWGIHPDMVFGHSLGECAAAVAAGLFTLRTGLKMLVERSRLIDTLKGGGMLVVRADESTVQQLLKQVQANANFWLDIAAVNSPDQTVLAGPTEAIQWFSKLCENNGIKVHPLDASHSFHSRGMDPILGEYFEVLKQFQKISNTRPKCEYISSVEGHLMESFDATYWVRHLKQTVQFIKGSQAAYAAGARVFIEVGAQPILSALISRNVDEILKGTLNEERILCLPSLKKKEGEWKCLVTTLGKVYTLGYPVEWEGFYKNDDKCRKVSLPSYPFQRSKYWFENDGVCFNNKMFSGKLLHPLAGFSMENPSTLKIYQNYLQLSKLDYIRDHVLGRRVIFPGAGYVELCLSAGVASGLASFEEFAPPAAPIVLGNVVIEAPFALEGDRSYEIQTVVAPGEGAESGWSNVEIYRMQGEDGSVGGSGTSTKWIRHATTSFSPVVSEIDHVGFEDMDGLRGRFTLGMDPADFYERIDKFGLKFGPRFRSLKKVWTNGGETLSEVQVPDEFEDYLCHPVVIDAMIQAVMISDAVALNSFSVPVQIHRFIWYGRPSSRTNYIHVTQGFVHKTALLLDENGQALAKMEGVLLLETSLESIDKSLEAQKLVMPLFMESIWKKDEGSGLLGGKLRHGVLSLLGSMPISELDKLSDSEEHSMRQMDKIITLSIIKTLSELGVNPDLGDMMELDSLLKTTGIQVSKRLLLGRCLEILSEDGYLSPGTQGWIVSKVFPTRGQCLSEITDLFASSDSFTVELKLLNTCLSKLTDVLQGTESVLPILFPTDAKGEFSAAKFYTEVSFTKQLNLLLEKTLDFTASNGLLGTTASKRVLKVLEIGAGTGGTTANVLPVLAKHGLNYKYTYTDISTSFFTTAEQTFKEYSKEMEFRLLNIEEDPTEQGFAPGDFDIVISAHCLHATKDLRETVRNCRMLLKENGLSFIVELLKPDRRIDAIFGLLDGYWLFNDFDLRPSHCLMDHSRWERVLLGEGFDQVSTLRIWEDTIGIVVGQVGDTAEWDYDRPRTSSKKAWLMFGSDEVAFENELQKKIKQLDRTVFKINSGVDLGFNRDKNAMVINPAEKSHFDEIFKTARSQDLEIEGIVYLWGIRRDVLDQEVISQGLMHLSQILVTEKLNRATKLFLITEGISAVGDQTAGILSGATLLGFSKSFRSENPTLHCRCVELDADTPERSKVDAIFSELWKDSREHHVFYQQDERHIPRMNALKATVNTLTIPTSPRYALQLPKSKAIGDLRYVPVALTEVAGKGVEVQVKTVGLNFKDVLNILKPTAEFNSINVTGADFSGVVSAVGSEVSNWAVGDAVIGLNFTKGALASHIQVLEHELISLPQSLTFTEGSTLPTVFVTAYYCLVTVGRLQKGETILIHTASGGVGLMAIQVAKYIGANIIATAGSKRKRAYLRSLGVENVFHSRNLTFGEDIRKVTGDMGVDMVLNSLTSPGFKETSLESCNKGSRFIEMSKLNIWSVEEVGNLRPDVEYSIVDLTTVSPEEHKSLLDNLQYLLKKGAVKPIPSTRFDGTDIREALNYLQKAKQIGKVVCEMPQVQKGEVVKTLFNDRSTYLITGGLGGIGLELVQWMVKLGAKYVILCSRRQPNDRAISVIQSLNDRGAEVTVKNTDIGSFDECKMLLEMIKGDKSLPPLRGIMHAAGGLVDSVLQNQTWSKFEAVYNGKLKGAWHLHLLTLDYNLEHFVLFSSISSVLGMKGQSNYAAANAFLDSLAHYRQASGLVATSVNWGQWGLVGMAAEMEIPGLSPFTPQQGLNALEWVMKSQRLQTVVYEGDPTIWPGIFPWVDYLLEDMSLKASTTAARGSKTFQINSGSFWNTFETLKGKEQVEFMSGTIGQIVATTIRMKPEELDGNQSFETLGMDSLSMVELKNGLQGLLGDRALLSVGTLAEFNTVRLLSLQVLELVGKAGQDGGGVELEGGA